MEICSAIEELKSAVGVVRLRLDIIVIFKVDLANGQNHLMSQPRRSTTETVVMFLSEVRTKSCRLRFGVC